MTTNTGTQTEPDKEPGWDEEREVDGDTLAATMVAFGVPCGMFAPEHLNKPIKD